LFEHTIALSEEFGEEEKAAGERGEGEKGRKILGPFELSELPSNHL
jgi:hypothetical protein